MSFLRRIPWWGWLILAIALMFMFGKTKISVGNINVGGKDLGGFKYDSEADKKPAK